MAVADIDFLIMGSLFILAITFMLLCVLREESPNPLEASITTILWFIIALYYPTFEPAIPGMSWLFFGLGLIFIIVTIKSAIEMLGERKSRRWSVEM